MNTKEQIEKLMHDYESAHHNGDGAAIAAMFLDKAVIIPPGQTMLQGKAAIQEFYKDLKGGSNMKTESFSIDSNGELACVNGEVSWLENNEKKYLMFVNVLKHKNDQWMYHLLTWNTNDGYVKS